MALSNAVGDPPLGINTFQNLSGNFFSNIHGVNLGNPIQASFIPQYKTIKELKECVGTEALYISLQRNTSILFHFNEKSVPISKDNVWHFFKNWDSQDHDYNFICRYMITPSYIGNGSSYDSATLVIYFHPRMLQEHLLSEELPKNYDQKNGEFFMLPAEDTLPLFVTF